MSAVNHPVIWIFIFMKHIRNLRWVLWLSYQFHWVMTSFQTPDSKRVLGISQARYLCWWRCCLDLFQSLLSDILIVITKQLICNAWTNIRKVICSWHENVKFCNPDSKLCVNMYDLINHLNWGSNSIMIIYIWFTFRKIFVRFNCMYHMYIHISCV